MKKKRYRAPHLVYRERLRVWLYWLVFISLWMPMTVFVTGGLVWWVALLCSFVEALISNVVVEAMLVALSKRHRPNYAKILLMEREVWNEVRTPDLPTLVFSSMRNGRRRREQEIFADIAKAHHEQYQNR